MLQNISEMDDKVEKGSESDEYMTVFFVFDSVLENSGMQSQAALQLFKNIQNESLQ
ncbi:MAG: hypothetical protein V5A88_02660 [Candidatus Thermoplasmatota archaeon]